MRRLIVPLGVLLAVSAAPAAAQTPAGCATHGLTVTPTWDTGKGRIGLPSAVKVRVTQSGVNVCDVSGVTIKVALPSANGQPSATTAPLVDAAAYPHNMAPATLSSQPWIVALNPGVTQAFAKVSWSGTVRDNPVGSGVSGESTVALPIVAPKLGFTVTADPATGSAPLNVTYRFALTNQGTPPADPLTSVALAHPNCTPVRQSGDTNANNALDAGETWSYTCTQRFDSPIEYTSVSHATAISASDGRGVSAPPANTVVKVPAASTPHGRLTLATVADPASGFAPLTVAYTYTVRNEGTGPVKDVTVTAAGCSPTTTAANVPLEAGATRTFTCSRVFGELGTFTVGAIGSGIDLASGLAVNTGQVRTDVTTTAVAAASPTPVATASPEPDLDATPVPTRRRAATISALAGKRKVAKATRKVTIATIACPAGATCSISAPKTAKLKLGKKTYTLAVTAAKRLAGSRKLNVTLTLSRAAYAKLKSGTVSVKVSATATGASTTSMTVKANITR